jgi:hypothetical protein
MSALPPKADIRCGDRDVCFVPKADIYNVDNGISSSAERVAKSGGVLCASHHRAW